MIPPNPITTLVNLLRADADVAAAAGTITVYGQKVVAVVAGDIDDQVAALMPRRLVLVEEAGGTRPEDQTPRSYPRVDVTCYGAARGGAYDASMLSWVVYHALQGAQDRRCGLGAVTMEAGPHSGRDGTLKAAINVRTYRLLAEA